MRFIFFCLVLALGVEATGLIQSNPVSKDPCEIIAGKKWVSPLDARACMFSFPLDPIIKANILDVVNKTLAFHASVNYQIQAPSPYDNDVHEDLVANLQRISKQEYSSEFGFHIDLYRSFKRVNDGHCGVYNMCYDSLYVTYLPTPLVLLTEPDGTQHVRISPEAFKIASTEFGDEIQFWQDALPEELRGKLELLSGAKVFLINGQEPFVAVNANTLITGSYQSFGTRQNSFFSSYDLGPEGWQYAMGNFAQQVHPLTDVVELTVQCINSTNNDTFVLPYRSRFGSGSINFTNLASYRENNCMATNETNGIDFYAKAGHSYGPTAFYQQQPSIDADDHREPVNVILDGSPLTNIDLPEILRPEIPPLNDSYSVAQFYALSDNTTGVLALGSFSAKNFTLFGERLLSGLLRLKALGVQNLIVDVTNNGGGYICMAHWLHRIIIGPKNTTEPQAGLDSTTRVGPLAQLIVETIVNGGDPEELLSYNPIQWTNATHQPFPPGHKWLKPLRALINGHEDFFSQRLGQECQPFRWNPPNHQLFKPQDILIVSNGRCGSSCSLFSITMAKKEGVRTVVVGGKNDVRQDYCGTVGGQSTHFAEIDSEIKTSNLKSHLLAPPDFLTNNVQGITWRLGYGITNPSEPEEWQSHSADINFALSWDMANKPVAIWEKLAQSLFVDTPIPAFKLQNPGYY